MSILACIGIALQVWIVTPVVWMTQEMARIRREVEGL